MAMLSPRRGGFAANGAKRRGLGFDPILWGIPIALVVLAGILIASTQRQQATTDWYQHWITAAVGLVLAVLLSRVPLERIARFQWPIYGLMVASLIAVRIIGVSALGAQSWINIGGFYVQPS